MSREELVGALDQMSREELLSVIGFLLDEVRADRQAFYGHIAAAELYQSMIAGTAKFMDRTIVVAAE